VKRCYELDALRKKNYIHDSHIHAVRIAGGLTTNEALRNVLKDLEEKLFLIRGLRIVQKNEKGGG